MEVAMEVLLLVDTLQLKPLGTLIAAPCLDLATLDLPLAQVHQCLVLVVTEDLQMADTTEDLTMEEATMARVEVAMALTKEVVNNLEKTDLQVELQWGATTLSRGVHLSPLERMS
jgi:hypothetical protein